MAPYSLSGVIHVSGSPEIPKLIWKDVISTWFKLKSSLWQFMLTLSASQLYSEHFLLEHGVINVLSNQFEILDYARRALWNHFLFFFSPGF